MTDRLALIDLAHEAEFTLGPLLVRPSLRTVVAGGREDLLEPRVMQVLVALVRRAGEVVSRDDLVALCWGGRIVGEDAIGRPVAIVRKLGEESGAFAIDTIARVGYRLRPSGETASGGASIVASASRATSPAQGLPPRAVPVLAVLAFDNLSGDPGLAYFSDGISDEILQAVSRVVKTIGRGSSFQFRGADKATRKVAAELGASHVLDGSVRRGGDTVRISAQLIDAGDQTTVWQNQFDRRASDLMAVQDEIAVAVATALNQKLRPAPATGEIDPETYALFLRLRHGTLNMQMPERSRIDLADQVTRRAQAFGPGWIEAGRARAAMRRNQALEEAESSCLYEEMETAFARATQLLGPDDPRLTAVVVNWAPWAGAWTQSEMRLRRALEASPWSTDLRATLAELLGHAGRHSESLDLVREMFEREPLQAVYAIIYAARLGALGRHVDACAVYEPACRRWPESALLWRSMVTAAARQGFWDIVDRWTTPEHMARYRHQARQFDHTVEEVELLRRPDAAKAATLLARLTDEVKQTGRIKFSDMAYVAQFCDPAAVHDLCDQASFAHVFDPRRGHNSRDWGTQALFQAQAQRLRSNPRFVRLCARLGLVHHWTEVDRWPDCANTVPYDFRAEARRIADTPLG